MEEPCQRSSRVRFGKRIIAYNYFCKHSVLNVWEGPGYVPGFKYVKDVNIPELSISQDSEFPGLHMVYLFS